MFNPLFKIVLSVILFYIFSILPFIKPYIMNRSAASFRPSVLRLLRCRTAPYGRSSLASAPLALLLRAPRSALRPHPLREEGSAVRSALTPCGRKAGVQGGGTPKRGSEAVHHPLLLHPLHPSAEPSKGWSEARLRLREKEEHK